MSCFDVKRLGHVSCFDERRTMMSEDLTPLFYLSRHLSICGKEKDKAGALTNSIKALRTQMPQLASSGAPLQMQCSWFDFFFFLLLRPNPFFLFFLFIFYSISHIMTNSPQPYMAPHPLLAKISILFSLLGWFHSLSFGLVSFILSHSLKEFNQ